jgi:hypothetical protein
MSRVRLVKLPDRLEGKDADTVDGYHATAFVQLAAISTGNISVTGYIQGAQLLMLGNRLEEYSYNGEVAVAINYHGYANGTTQFRNLTVYDGKEAVVANFVGSSKNLYIGGAYCQGTTQVVGAQGAAVANATDAASTMARLNDLLARCRAHGLIAT